MAISICSGDSGTESDVATLHPEAGQFQNLPVLAQYLELGREAGRGVDM